MKIFLKIIGILLVLIVLALLSADHFIGKIIDNKIRSIQTEVSDEIDFDYAGLSFSFLQKKIALKDFHIETLSDSLEDQDRIKLQLKKLILIFEGFEEVLFEGKLHLKEVILRSPTINYGIAQNLSKDKVPLDSIQIETVDLKEEVENKSADKLIKSILIDDFKVSKGEAHFYNVSDENKSLIDVKSISVNSKMLEFDMEAVSLENKVKSEAFDIEMKGITSHEIKNHDLNIEKLNYNIKNRSLVISDIHLRNNEKAKTFSAKQKYRAIWLDIMIDKVTLDINPFKIYNKGLIYLKMIEVDGLHAEIYNDVTLALKPYHKPMPPRMIREIPVPFKIDSLIVRDSELTYLHKGKPDKPGLMAFDDINITMANITNIDYVIDENPLMKMDISTKIWDKGNLTNSVVIDLKNPNDFVYSKGKLTNLPLKEAEKMLKPLYGVQISSGKLSNLSFDLTMNEDLGKGTMRFDYSDLKVDIKKGNKDKNQDVDGNLKSNKFLNFIANEAVVNSNMPDSKHYKETGVMIFDRTKNKPIFDLFWNCTQVGIMDFTINDLLYQSESNYLKKEKKKDKREEKEQKKKDRK